MRLCLLGEFLPSVAAPEQVGLEDLRRRPEAQALARRCIEAGTELTEFLLGERVRIGVAAQPASEPLVGVFHSSFLPG